MSHSVNGHLDLSWQAWLGKLEIAYEVEGTTILSEHLPDQAAHYGVLLSILRLGGKSYCLTGPQPLTHREQVRLLGEALGHPLHYEELDEEEACTAISPYAPADVLFTTWKQYIGTPAPVTDTIQRLTGRPPRSAEAWGPTTLPICARPHYTEACKEEKAPSWPNAY